MATSASKQLVLILLLLNASAGAVTATGIGDALQINPELGAEDQVEQVNQSARNVQSSQSGVATLFGALQSGLNTVKTIFTLVFYGPVMLINLGVPSEIMALAAAGSSVIVGTDLIYLVTGRRL